MKYWLLEKLKNLPFIKKKAKAAPIQSTDEEDLAEQELWWGTFLIEEEQSRFFKIGQLVTCVDRFNHNATRPCLTFSVRSPLLYSVR